MVGGRYAPGLEVKIFEENPCAAGLKPPGPNGFADAPVAPGMPYGEGPP